MSEPDIVALIASLRDALVRQQDYFWFLSATGFLAAFLLGVRARAAEHRSLHWIALGDCIVAVIELMGLPSDDPVGPQFPPYLLTDVVEGAILGGQVWSLWAENRKPLARLGWGLLVAALVWSRDEHPWLATLMLSLTGTVAIVWPRHRRSALTSESIVLTSVALWCSPVGPLSCAMQSLFVHRLQPVIIANAPIGGPLNGLSVGLRRWSNPDDLGLIVSVAFLASAMGMISSQLRQLRQDRERTEWKRFRKLALVWLVFGMFLAAFFARRARTAYEETVLSYAKLSAKLANPALLQAAFGEAFVLAEIHPGRAAGIQHANVGAAYRATLRPVRRFLTQIEENAATEIAASIVIDHRSGWRVVAANSDRIQIREPRSVMIVGRRDQFVDEPLEPSYRAPRQTGARGRIATAQAPLRGSDGRLIGWLVLKSSPEAWHAGQAQVRMQAFAIIAMGLALGVMGVRQRLKVIERDEARSADQAKTDFLARVSHELRTPIQSVLGYSELLKPDAATAAAQSRLAALQQHGRLMLRLVNDLLNLSALQNGRFPLSPKPTHIAPLVQQTAETLRPEAETKGLDFRVDISNAPCGWHMIDGERLRQVVLNLVGNAIKFTDAGEVRIALVGQGGSVTLQIEDTGPGISLRDLDRLFKPFVRLEHTSIKEGSGLGLALTKALCEHMGGTLSVDSRLGAGSKFRVDFLLPECAEPAYAKPDSVPLSLASRRILVVDDNTLIRELFCDYLRGTGAHCVAVEHAEAALTALTADRFDAAVLDLNLPGTSGVELARCLRERIRHPLRLIAVSAHADTETAQRALAAGADCFLQKPVPLPDLAVALGGIALVRNEELAQRSGLIERLQAQFRAEASVLAAALNAAVVERDWAIVQTKAHYLKNSADVLGLRALAVACRDLEDAARHRNPNAAVEPLYACNSQLAEWR